MLVATLPAAVFIRQARSIVQILGESTASSSALYMDGGPHDYDPRRYAELLLSSSVPGNAIPTSSNAFSTSQVRFTARSFNTSLFCKLQFLLTVKSGNTSTDDGHYRCIAGSTRAPLLLQVDLRPIYRQLITPSGD